jgi:2-dehydro-3-deoxy-D-gluconate 5-dehydrogenase
VVLRAGIGQTGPLLFKLPQLLSQWFRHLVRTLLSLGSRVASLQRQAIELAPFNIQVNAIAPGFIDTDMVAPLKTMPLYEQIIARTPAGRFGTPEECAGTAIYLASQASDFVTGTTLFLDGGYAIRL